jgi:eukaryotic-like serine/threonine-protein kinase
MFSLRLQRSFINFLGFSLLFLLAACGTGPTTILTPTPTSTAIPGATSVSTHVPSITATPSGKPVVPASNGGNTTVPMPQTQTSCPLPAAEAGRAAVIRPLVLGNHASIAYIFNEGTPGSPTFGELKRYDVITGNKTVIVHQANANIAEAQVSADGQWLLFVSNMPRAADTAGTSALQLIRLDGKGLQTLFCAPLFSLRGVQWSSDQKFVVFSIVSVPGTLDIYMLNLSSGAVQPELVYTDRNLGFEARTWLDKTRVYVVGVPNNTPVPLESLYILDTKKGANQHPNNLLQVIQPRQSQYCWDFDSDYNTTKLVTSSCTVSFPVGSTDRGVQQGPGNISVQLISGGQGNKIYASAQLAVAQVRLLGYSSNRLLLTIENQNYGANVPIDTSQNGLWKMNIDGSGLTRLTAEDTGNESNLNLFTQYPWSNVSFDGRMYALQVTNIQSKDPITTLVFGELNGGKTTAFAFAHTNSGTVEVAGWTFIPG